MSRNDLIDWFINRQDRGIDPQFVLTVGDLIYIQDHIEQFVHAKPLIYRDMEDIMQRMKNGESAYDISKDYKIAQQTMRNYLNDFKKQRRDIL